MSSKFAHEESYSLWIADLKKTVHGSQIKAALSVNQELLRLYWHLGKELTEKERTAKWGEGLIDQVSKDLSAAFPAIKGFSQRNLQYVRQWYLFYSQSVITPQVVAQLGNAENIDYQKSIKPGDKSDPDYVEQIVVQIPWGHHRLILDKITKLDEALFYVHETIMCNWSRAVLALQIESRLYERKGKAIHNFNQTLPLPQADLATDTLKSSYNFDLLSLSEEAFEREVETGLSKHIQKFLLELGQGFAFLGRQVHLDLEGEDFYIDLLFYHTRLRCYVVVEIKCSDFKPEFVGKLNFYVNVVDLQMRQEWDQPTIGLLLCKTPKKVVVEYSLKNVSNPLGISDYDLAHSIPDDARGELPSSTVMEEALLEYQY